MENNENKLTQLRTQSIIPKKIKLGKIEDQRNE